MTSTGTVQPVLRPTAAVKPAIFVDVIVAGVAVGLAGLCSFIAVHSLLIFPIWGRWPRGIVPAVLAGVAGAITLAIGSGATAGWMATGRRQAAAAMTGATLALTIVMGGPMPIVNNAHAAWLFIAFLPISLTAGLTLTLTRRWLIRKRTR